MTVRLKINGQFEYVSDDLTIRDLLQKEDVDTPDMVSVELNGIILEKIAYDTTKVHENDEVEVLYFMQGG